MEIFLIVAALAVAGYYFVRGNTKRGAEVVRAYVFMDVVEAGGTLDVATQVASVDVSQLPTALIRNAMARLQRDFGGRQAAMISFAYGLGMPSRLPGWYQVIIKTAASKARPA